MLFNYTICYKNNSVSINVGGLRYTHTHTHTYLIHTNKQAIKKKRSQKFNLGTSLVAQWLRIHLPMQGTQVRSLFREDPTCHGATKPVHHNYWACALEPMSHNYWTHVPQLLKPEHMRWSPRATRYKLQGVPSQCSRMGSCLIPASILNMCKVLSTRETHPSLGV